MGVISDVIVVIRERYKANTKMLEKTIKDWKVYAEDANILRRTLCMGI